MINILISDTVLRLPQKITLSDRDRIPITAIQVQINKLDGLEGQPQVAAVALRLNDSHTFACIDLSLSDAQRLQEALVAEIATCQSNS